jgi:aryl-alcohol dehydrogenase-like predicted oxidoreductase
VNYVIPKQKFGRTEHRSTRVIFGSYALSEATQAQADRTLPLLQKYGVNHIDTAPSYGNAEKLIGPWLQRHRKNFFISTKTRSRSRKGAMKDLEGSLERLCVNHIDLWQMHALTNQGGWERAMGPGGTLEAFVEARDTGAVRFLGVTGHGDKAAAMHRLSLERFDFDTILLPYSYVMMQKSRYASDFEELVRMCNNRSVALQTIKSVARRPWGSRSRTHNTYFYEPLENQTAIDGAVHWALGLEQCFLVTPGDLKILPKVLDAASRFQKRPSDAEMMAIVDRFDIQAIRASMSDLK